MSRFHVCYTRGVWCLLLLVGSMLGGLQLSRWLAGHRAVAEVQRYGPIHLPKTPDPAVTSTWVELFNAARQEIWLAAGRLESEAVLRSLDAAAKRGVVVHVTLSPAQNPSAQTGARAWLRHNTTIRDVRIAAQRFDGSACVVDDHHAVISAQGLLAANASAEDAGIFFYTTGPAVCSPLSERLRVQHHAGQNDLPSL